MNTKKEIFLEKLPQRISAFLNRFPEDRLHHRSYLEKLNDNELIDYLLSIGFLKEELPGFYYFNTICNLPYKTNRTFTEERFFPCFSIFKNPITNKIPIVASTSLIHAHKYIKSPRAKLQTETLRNIKKRPDLGKRCPNKVYKNNNFYYACFSGVFKERSETGLIKHSNLLCIDLDHLEDVVTVRENINKDQHTLMSFISPNGDGLKVIFRIQLDLPQRTYYSEISKYLCNLCGISLKSADLGTHDVSRATFLPHDPEAYLHPDLLNDAKE